MSGATADGDPGLHGDRLSDERPVPRALYVLGIFLAVILLVDAGRVADPDLFVTLYAGEEIVRHGGVPKVDTVSFSVPGKPWNDYEWLARVIFYKVYAALGGAGLTLMRAGLVLAILGLFSRQARRFSARPWIFGAGLTWFVLCSGPYVLFRPRLFTFLAVTALLTLFEIARSGRPRILWVVPGMVALWVNLHGGYAFGIALVGLLATESVVVAMIGRGGDVSRQFLPVPATTTVPVLLVSLLAGVLNPYGVENLTAVFHTLGSGVTGYISEWQPMFAFPLSRFIWVYLLMTLIWLLLILCWEEASLFDLALLAVLTVASLARVRFVPLFGIVATMLALKLMPSLIRDRANRLEPTTRATFNRLRGPLTALGIMAAVFVATALNGERDLSIRLMPYYTPVGGVRFLKLNGIGGNILNEYDWGGYIRFRMPDTRIFVDGRSDSVYPEETTREWAMFVQGQEGWHDIAERHDARIAFLRRSQPVVAKLASHPDWAPLYIDSLAAIYLRRSAAEAELLQRVDAGLLEPVALVPRDFVLE